MMCMTEKKYFRKVTNGRKITLPLECDSWKYIVVIVRSPTKLEIQNVSDLISKDM